MSTNNERPHWFLYPIWMVLSFLCIPGALFLDIIVRLIITQVVGDLIYVNGELLFTEDYLFTYTFIPMVGLLTGVLQYASLRRYLPRMGWWVLAITGGWLLGVLLFLITDRNRSLDLGLMFLVMGLAIGIAQWLLLRRQLSQPGWWIIALVVDNLAMGRPSMGGIRMLPDLPPTHLFNLARGMTLKNAAALLPFGGGKVGIVTDPGISRDEHSEIVRRFAHLLYRYRDIFLPGPDVGTNDEDMKTIAMENGLDNVVSKPSELGGNRIDQLGAAGGGLIITIETLLEELPRLSSLSRVCKQSTDSNFILDVIIQGFGAVGAHAAKILQQRHPDHEHQLRQRAGDLV